MAKKRPPNIKHMPDGQVASLANGHVWDEVPYDGQAPPRFNLYPKSNTEIIQWRCVGAPHVPGCGEIRYDLWSYVTGEVIDRDYRQPEG